MTQANVLIGRREDVERVERTPLRDRYSAASTYDLLREAAERHGGRDALIFVPRGNADDVPVVFSHADLLERVTRAANLFRRLGVGPRDVVAYVLPNLPQTHFALWGAEAAGIACAVNPMLEASHMVDILRAAGA